MKADRNLEANATLDSAMQQYPCRRRAPELMINIPRIAINFQKFNLGLHRKIIKVMWSMSLAIAKTLMLKI
jgi:hypothetical protein